MKYKWNAFHRYCHNYHHGLWLRSQQVIQMRTKIKLLLSHCMLKIMIIIPLSANKHHLYPTPCSLSITLSFLFCSFSISLSPVLLIIFNNFPHSAGRCQVPPHMQFRPLGLSQLRKSTRIPWEFENENKELKVEHVKVDARVSESKSKFSFPNYLLTKVKINLWVYS